jgi:general secretion pathway protein M
MADPVSRVVRASPRARRVIALGLLAAVAALAGCLTWLAVSSIGALQREIAYKRETLGRFQAIVALKPALLRDSTAGAVPQDSGDFLEGKSEAIALSNMQRQLSSIFSDQRANLVSISNIPELRVGDARYVGIRADLSGSVDAVYNAIFAIEISKSLIIRSASMWVSDVGQGPAATQAPEIFAQVQVYGALRPELATPAAKAEP